ncbi:C2H2 and C2HC zinc fingers superfamily protein [Tanacetum coccineum]
MVFRGNPLDLNNLPEDLASDHDKQPLHNSSPAAAQVGGSYKKKKNGEKDESRMNKVYECRFCSLTFCKSQALGGHMNRHRQEREKETLNRARQLVFGNDNLHKLGSQPTVHGGYHNQEDCNMGSNIYPTRLFSSTSTAVLPPLAHPHAFTSPYSKSQPRKDNYTGHVCLGNPQFIVHNLSCIGTPPPDYGTNSYTCLGEPVGNAFTVTGGSGGGRYDKDGLEWGGERCKGENVNGNKTNTSSGIGVFTESHDTMNGDTPVGVASALKEGVTPSVVDITVEMDKISSLKDATVMGSFLPLSTPVTTTAGNAPDMSSYANVTGKPSGKKLNIRTLFTPGGNGIDVLVPVDSIRAISKRFADTAYGFFLGEEGGIPYSMLENGPWFIRNNPLILKKWHPDENLLKGDVSNVPVWVKLYGVLLTAFREDGLSVIATKLGTPLMLDSYTSDMCMQSWVGFWTYIHEECPKNTCADEKKTVKKPSQTSRGVPVGPKMGFKPQKEYRHVPKNTTANSSGNKKKGVEPTIEVCNSNPFDVLNSVDNDEDIGTTPIMDKIGKFENLVIDGQAILVDKDSNPLKKVEYPGDHDSEDEVASVDNDMTRDLDSERNGFGTQSLLEQWRDSYGNGDYDEDPYDDDMYEGQDLSDEILTICDKLDIRV